MPSPAPCRGYFATTTLAPAITSFSRYPWTNKYQRKPRSDHGGISTVRPITAQVESVAWTIRACPIKKHAAGRLAITKPI